MFPTGSSAQAELLTRPRQPRRGTHRRTEFRHRPARAVGAWFQRRWNKSFGHMTAGNWWFTIGAVILVVGLLVLALAALAYYRGIGARPGF